MDFEEIMQKAVNAEAKMGLRSSTIIQDLDIHCPQDYRLSHNTSLKVQIQGTTAKKPRIKESRLRKAKLTNGKTFTSPYSDESAKPNCKKKKREWLKKKKDSTPATKDNAIEGKKKRTPSNISQVTYYKYQKKDHFANKCSKPSKN